MRPLLSAAAILLAAASAAPLIAAHHEQADAMELRGAAALDKVLAASIRDGDRARDAWRHPRETLTFFRVEPDMTVIDYMPSQGWYTRILAPYLNEKGRYVALHPAPEGLPQAFGERMALANRAFVTIAPEWTGLPAGKLQSYNSDAYPAELTGKVDRFLIFREMHNLKRWKVMERELKVAHTMLAPDGMLGIVQHRAKADAPDAFVDGSKGYLREADVIAAVEAAGFELVGKSEINANPKDPADHEGGAWTLPPGLRFGDTDRAKYEAIGETDRMTLLFKKRA